MDSRLVLALFLCTLKLVTPQDFSFTSKPINAAVIAGPTVTFRMTCDSPTIEMGWYETTVNTSRPVTFGSNLASGPASEGYILHNSDGGFDLTVPVKDLVKAGDYRCSLIGDTEKFAFAKLVVLVSNPVCHANVTGILIEGENVRYTCEVNYKGELPPKMNWYEDEEIITDVIDESSVGMITKTSIDITAMENKDGKVYKADTFFDEPESPGTDFATNEPDYKNSYSYPALEVHWPPKDVKILPEGSDIYVGSDLECSASSAKPAVNYFIWIDVSDNDTILAEGDMMSAFKVPQEWLNEVKIVRCIVRNPMKGGSVIGENASEDREVKAYMTTPPPTTTTVPTTPTTRSPSTSIEPTTKPDTGGSTPKGDASNGDEPPVNVGAIVGGVVGGVAFVVVMLLIIYCVCIKGKRKEDEANNTRPQKPIPADKVRKPEPLDVEKNNFSAGPYDTTPPPAYDTTDPYGNHMNNHPNHNMEGLVYADLALDDTPRSRKPIQFPMDQDATLYADIRQPGPMV